MGAVMAATSPARALPREQARRLGEVDQALRELRVEDAEEQVVPLLGRHATDADVLLAAARVRFHQGEYDEAVGKLEASLARRPAGPPEADPRPAMLELYRSTRDATSRYVEARSEDGRFVIRHAPGRDRHLVAYALRALEGADRALQEELGFRMPGPVRLEIYPTARSLAEVSTLSVEAIERTGTIALCKWDKLMVTSPRALLRGYPWMDTIAHEYVHLVLTRASRDRAPVWLQEGVAKFLERRWREPEARPHLAPAMDALLRRKARERELIPFDRIHPSIALLPSQEDAALAFAQVSTFIATFYAEHGRAGLQAAVERIAAGADAREALAAVAGEPWARLEDRWRAGLRAEAPPDDAPRLLRMRLRHGEGEGDESPEVAERARRYLRLGDLLWARRRSGAAAREYERALEVAPGDPIIASRLARAAVAGGQAERAVEALEPVAERYPEHAPTQAVLARALSLTGDTARARRFAERAIRLNPFDPAPHCVLAEVAEDEAERATETRRCRELGGTSGAR
ncbi:MAG: hypothetical protein CMN31_10255 [Sandaracinus sp.]|nr:hypothetical protein [Sandaracinus sp.]MBJ71706.1 hypothetical protein [Sandaracinus sp.]